MIGRCSTIWIAEEEEARGSSIAKFGRGCVANYNVIFRCTLKKTPVYRTIALLSKVM